MVVPGAKTGILIGRLLQLPVIRNLVLTVTKDSIFTTGNFFSLDTSEMGTWLFTPESGEYGSPDSESNDRMGMDFGND
jgi:hypothetical protein